MVCAATHHGSLTAVQVIKLVAVASVASCNADLLQMEASIQSECGDVATVLAFCAHN